MNDKDYALDLPIPLRTDDLPIPAAEVAPRHEIASPCYSQWFNLANQCHIRSLATDPLRGDLWLATGGGILRWWSGLDRYTRYSSEHGLPGNSVRSVIVDGNGQPWATHEEAGISYLDGDTWHSYLPLAGIPAHCLTTDATGQLWVGTDAGLYSVPNPTDEPTLVELPLHSPPPRAIAIATSEDIWLCTAQGVFHRQEEWKRYNSLPTILTLARQGKNLWVATLDGLIRIDLTTSQSHPAGEPRTEVSALAPTENGVWAACGRQVGFATETSWTPMNGRACDLVTSLAPASNEGVWIGTHTGLQYANSTTSRFHLTEAPPDVVGVRSPNEPPTGLSNLVQALTVQQLDNTAVLWVGTARGLFRIDLSTETWRRPGQLSKQDIRAIAVTESEQNLWVASWARGLYKIQQTANLVSSPDFAGPITTLTTGLKVECWAGGLTGIYWYDGTQWELIVPAKKLPEAAWVRAIALSATKPLAQSKLDCLWLGTSVGLLLYNLNTKIVSPASGILSSTPIQSILALPTDPSTPLWIGTQHGLYHGQPEELKPVPGLEKQSITALAADTDTRKIWVGTDRGLFCLSNIADTWDISDEFTVHTSGLAHHRIIALAIDSSRSDKTRLWIGTPWGLSAYTYESG